MNYYDILKEREKYKIAENLYKCPICKAEKTIKGFIQHVKNHFFERDISNFRNAGNEKNKKLHRSVIDNYNKKPNMCLYCNEPILAKEHEKIYYVKKRKFCSSSCSAKYSNTHRCKDIYLKIKETWNIKLQNGEVDEIVKNRNQVRRKIEEKECAFCGKIFTVRKNKQVFCSSECREKSYGSKEELIEWANDFIKNNGFVPTSKISGRMTRLAKENFGSWNNFIKELGYEPRKQMYGKGSYLCKDGHISDSISEIVIDNWLFENNIKHERRKIYPNSKKDCDFYLSDYDIWIEFFGLLGEDDKYDKTAEEKRTIARENGINMLEITAKDLFPKNKLEEKILKFLV